MAAVFNAENFISKLKSGEFDGRLVEELRALSEDQLEEVVGLIVEQRRELNSPSSDPSTGVGCCHRTA